MFAVTSREMYDETMAMAESIIGILENYVLKVGRALDTHDLEALLDGTRRLSVRDLGNEPEAWTEQNLIFPVLSACELDWDPRPSRNADVPDFEVRGLHEYVIGENKPPNDFASALRDIKRYLRDKAFKSEFGIATDGLTWGLYRIDLGSDFPVYSEIARVCLRDAIRVLCVRLNLVDANVDASLVDQSAKQFIDVFARDRLDRLLLVSPQKLQEDKNRDVEDFYDLYSELLFGKGRTHQYDTRLLDDLLAPAQATEEEKHLFAICLVNRLFFIRFLEGRVLPEGFLSEIVRKYNEASGQLASSLYESQIKPLFYKLFNTPKQEREPKYLGTFFDVVPYLNGGLFRPNIPSELEYDVRDRILPTLITDLIEGHELRSKGRTSLDPAVLGHVFEKTINFISSEVGMQEDLGAFYTPSDVTRLVTSQTVDLKMRDIIAEVFASRYPESEDVLRSLSLQDMLLRIARRQGWFGDPSAIEEAYEKLGRIRVLDPACGSGHFLTTVMEEVHRTRLPLINALGKSNPEDYYESKKELALNCIYGVDVVPIAVEIAKLRIWLKIIEEGWAESYGELPNIDFNIVAGNSLFGLPIPGADRNIALDIYGDTLEEFTNQRERYKSGIATKSNVLEARQRLALVADAAYVNRLDFKIPIKVRAAIELSEVLDNEGSLYPRLGSLLVKAPREIDEDLGSLLSGAGFRVHTRSARLPIRFKSARSLDLQSIRAALVLALERGCSVEVNRRPTLADLESIRGRPFHWPAEFATIETDGSASKFDVVLGNPPYGDIMGEVEKALVKAMYKTGTVNEIAAQFVEREVSLLAPGGYFGNVITLRLVYQTTAAVVRELMRDELEDAQIACFTSRPSKLFSSSDPRIGIVTGRKQAGQSILWTSEFIRFNPEERARTLKGITYQSTSELTLGDRIGDGKDKSLPKLGNETIRKIVIKLKQASRKRSFRDVISRSEAEATEHIVWRKRHPRYWINPFLENLHGSGNIPQDFQPMYFASRLERDAAFLILQSSLFYLFWMVYGNERDLNWGEIEAFPFPQQDSLESMQASICKQAEQLWAAMKSRFDLDRGEMRGIGDLKSRIDEADDLLGSCFELEPYELEFVKQYHASYGRRCARKDLN